MIDLSFLIPLVVIVVVMAKVSKEFSKVSRNRPTGGGSDDGTSGGGRVEGKGVRDRIGRARQLAGSGGGGLFAASVLDHHVPVVE